MARTKSSEKKKRFRPKLTSAQKEAHCKKLLGLTEDIDSARKVYQEAAHDIAEKHGRSQRWTRQQLFLGRLQHCSNPWNAFLRKKLREANQELEVGKRYRLTEFLRKKGSSLRHQYHTLTMEEKNLLAKEIDVVREQCFDGTNRIEGFYMAVRGSVEDYTEPKLFFSEKALRFMKDVLQLEPKTLALKFEACACPHKGTYSEQDEILQKGGIRIGKKAVEMNYHNYQLKIVEKYGIELQGWPTSICEVCNPSNVGTQAHLDQLSRVLESGACGWVVLSKEELLERKKKNQVYRPHKSSRKSGPSKKSAETIDDDEEGEGEDEDDTHGHREEGGDGAAMLGEEQTDGTDAHKDCGNQIAEDENARSMASTGGNEGAQDSHAMDVDSSVIAL
ncbi:hypothetical protein BJV78DRAFT_1158297 [Lactifluus subvellereus]|nr:hypothetical protein BJV78DRAFT_1158297 [Lactifluus subvellereus]